jgi:hypothetical protein
MPSVGRIRRKKTNFVQTLSKRDKEHPQKLWEGHHSLFPQKLQEIPTFETI